MTERTTAPEPGGNVSDPAAVRPAGQRREDAENYELEHQVGYLLRRAHQRATGIFMANATGLNLTPTQLAALAKISDEGRVSQNRLGRLTAMDPATMQGVIKRLSDRGLIDRGPDPTDRRRTVLTLTATGRALLEQAAPRSVKTSNETLEPLTPRQQEVFMDLLKRLT